MSEFSEKLLLLIVDNLVLALIVVCVGFWLNRALERFRFQVALRSDISKTTIAKMSDVYSNGYEWEKAVQAVIDGVAEAKLSAAGDKDAFFARLRADVTPLETEADRKGKAAGQKIDKERFWLTNEQYQQFLVYQDAVKNYARVATGAATKGDQLSVENARRRVDEARPNAHRLVGEVS